MDCLDSDAPTTDGGGGGTFIDLCMVELPWLRISDALLSNRCTACDVYMHVLCFGTLLKFI